MKVRFLFIILTGYFTFHAWPVFAAEDPDQLYRQGRFAEAETAYARLDMDNPKDIRYRYNRGSSSYQNADYKGAMAAFSSVLRRAGDDQIRFKAAYNMGNAAFKLSDFASAVAYYKQAVLGNPSSEDARYNLELALGEVEKQKKAESEKPDAKKHEGDHQPKDSPGEKKSEPSSDEKKTEKDPAKPPHKGDSQTQKENQNRPEKTQNTEKKTQNAEKKSPKDTQDLSGELKPLQALPEENKNNAPPEPPGETMDQRRAQALLDNIKEDPSRFMRFMIPADKRHGVASGKDW
ncbi:MAG: tetratricopeptide repeat protein [Desulfobacterales bacterium]|nr:tetratricopeptide repeat protein [Desulfobacterales bacterium]